MVNNPAEAWAGKDTVQYYTDNRNQYSELYPSEQWFLTREFLGSIRSVLDVGCAAGGFYEIFSGLNPQISYTGMDVVGEFIDQAGKRYPQAKFVKYAGSGPFPVREKYDLVFSSGLLHLVDNWKELFTRMTAQSRQTVLADFRLTHGPTYAGTFQPDFEDRERDGPRINYHVINAQDLRAFFKSLADLAAVEAYGYRGRPSRMAEGIADVWMVFFKCTTGYGNSAGPVFTIPENLRELFV